MWTPKDPRAILPRLNYDVSMEEGGRWKEGMVWPTIHEGQVSITTHYNGTNRRLLLPPEEARLWAKALEALAFEAELAAQEPNSAPDKTPL